jgi:hypothetical protein
MSKRLPIPFPVKGVDRSMPVGAQPKGTTYDMRNVHVRDPQSGRLRGGQRSGTTAVQDLGTGTGIKAMAQATAMMPSLNPLAFATLTAVWHKAYNEYELYSDPHDVTGVATVYKDTTTLFGYDLYAACATGTSSMDAGCTALVIGLGEIAGPGFVFEADYGDEGHPGYPVPKRAGYMIRATDATHPASNFMLSMGGSSTYRPAPFLTFDVTGYWAIHTGVGLFTAITDAYYSIRVGDAGEMDEAFTLSIGYRDTGEREGVPGDGGEPHTLTLLDGAGTVLWTGHAAEASDGASATYVARYAMGIWGGKLRILHARNNASPFTILHARTVSTSTRNRFAYGAAMLDGVTGDQIAGMGLADGWGGVPTVVTISEGTVSRAVVLNAISNAGLYCGQIGQMELIDTGLSATGPWRMADAYGDLYVADGGNVILKVGLTSQTSSDLTPSAGELPTAIDNLVVWRGRLLLHSSADTHNIFASKAGDPTDFDYAPAVANAEQAWALNAATAGKIGRPIQAMIPWRDDVLVIGTDSSIHSLQGDPADGGRMTTLAEGVGIWRQEAWCMEPNGVIWFYGPSGLFKMAPSGVPVPMGIDRIPDWLDEVQGRVSLQWDSGRGGVWLFTPRDNFPCLFYDALADAFEFHQFPESHGPTATLVYDGDGRRDRYLLLGGADGTIRKLDPDALSDDGTAISSYVHIGPLLPAGAMQQAMTQEMEFTFAGQVDSAAVVSIRHGKTPELAQAATPATVLSVATAGGRQIIRQRIRDEAFYLTIANSAVDTSWAFENGSVVFVPGGRSR